MLDLEKFKKCEEEYRKLYTEESSQPSFTSVIENIVDVLPAKEGEEEDEEAKKMDVKSKEVYSNLDFNG